jgi:hypothetical protein
MNQEFPGSLRMLKALKQNSFNDLLQKIPKAPLWKEVFMMSDQIRAETLVVKERFAKTHPLLPSFKIECYFIPIFGSLQEVVELSPLTWLPLIPTISLGRSIDMSHNVVSSSSWNAYETCGCFLGNPAFFIVSSAFAAGTLTWGVWNFWKLTSIKQMLLPPLVKDLCQGASATLLPLRYEDKVLLEEFNSSPSIFGWIESFFGEPAENEHEKLFGAAGAAGPKIYLLNSI